MKHILFFGSRTLDFDEHNERIHDQVAELVERYGRRGWLMVNGVARGADQMALDAAEYFGVKVEKFPAHWDRYGKAAGTIRNRDMLASGIDEAYGFVDKPLEESRGSYHMATILRQADIEPVITVLRPAR